MPAAPEITGLISLGAVFTLLFVTLGPLKIIGPFAHQTKDVAPAELRAIAVRAFVLALIAVVAGGFVGRALLHSWGIPAATMGLAGGIIFLLVGLSVVLEQYKPAHPAPPPLPAAPMAAAMRITFPAVVTPYGIAALIVLMANSASAARTLSVLGILVGVMVLNLLAMLYARASTAGAAMMALQILGAVLGVLQVALAVEMILFGLRGTGVLHA